MNFKSLSQFLRPYGEQILQFTGQKEINVKLHANTLFLTYYKKKSTTLSQNILFEI